MNFRAFTLKGKGQLKQLINECGISPSFDPRVEQETKIKVEKYKSLWDTGATGSVISKRVVDELSLKPTGKVKVSHANGETVVNTYKVNIYLPNQVNINFITVIEGILTGFDILIGMDIITLGDFSITNFKNETVFSFRIPSIKKVDFVTEHKP